MPLKLGRKQPRQRSGIIRAYLSFFFLERGDGFLLCSGTIKLEFGENVKPKDTYSIEGF